MKLSTPLALCASAILVVGCQTPSHTASTSRSDEHAGHAHWSYSGETGPAHWGELSPEYAVCATGHHQSPIDITSTVAKDLANIDFHYASMPLEIVNNGHTVQVNCAPGSFIVIDGVRYDLVQFHFHSPSEHEIDGRRAKAELHLVHKSEAGNLAVVGVMIESGAENSAFDPMWHTLPDHEGPAMKTNVSINPVALLPGDGRTIRYDGSLTTPPGTEGVKWNLMVQPITLSAQQLSAFQHVFNGNNRPIQPLNGRVVVKDTTP